MQWNQHQERKAGGRHLACCKLTSLKVAPETVVFSPCQEATYHIFNVGLFGAMMVMMDDDDVAEQKLPSP